MRQGRALKIIAVFAVAIVAALGLAACSSNATVPATTTTAPTIALPTTPSIPLPGVSTPTANATTTPTSNSTYTPVPTTTPPFIQYRPPASGNFTIGVGTTTDGRHYLTDGRGRTLYYATTDAPNLNMTDTTTLTAWPLFYAAHVIVPKGLNAADFGSIITSTGAHQTTFRGWPLYLSIRDIELGDALGEGVGNTWFTIDPDMFQPPQYYAAAAAWENGAPVQLYSFPVNATVTPDGKVPAGNLYVLITGTDASGKPQVVPGQHDIFDSEPGMQDYTGLWQVTYVTVPSDYKADTVTAFEQIVQQGYALEPTGQLVDRPIVPPGSMTATGLTLHQAWYHGHRVYYFDFGASATTPMPRYKLVTGTDANGNAQPVTGQHDIVTALLGDAGYSAFCRVTLVTVPQGYKANTMTSSANVTSSGDAITATDQLLNCPAVPGN